MELPAYNPISPPALPETEEVPVFVIVVLAKIPKVEAVARLTGAVAPDTPIGVPIITAIKTAIAIV
jgi:hypothetical protein